MRADTHAKIVLTALVLTAVGCNERTVTSTTPVNVAPSPMPGPAAAAPVPAPLPAPIPTPSPSPLPLTIFSMTFDRVSLFPGESATGTVRLSRPAPASGVVVMLTSNDPTAVVSPSVSTIAQDQDRVTLSVTTPRLLAEDRRIVITASISESSATATLQVWTLPRAQTFFTFISDPGDFIGDGLFVRVTSPEVAFLIRGNTSSMTIFMQSPDSWYARFEAPRGTQLGTRRYDNVAWVADDTHAGMQISGQSRGCTVVGVWFDVREFSVASNGDVSRVDVAFEQRCQNSPATLRGEIKFVR